MEKNAKRLALTLAVIIAAIVALVLISGCNDQSEPLPTEEPAAEGEKTPEPAEPVKVLAHWKLQDNKDYYTGSIDDDTIGFKDLTGNGNDLIAKAAGNGDQLDIFSWDKDISSASYKFGSALKLNNTKALAASVDPYKAAETEYTGGYTSGKYLETVKGAPINSYGFKNGVSIELIFKLSEDLDLDYNRYAGIFSRQGVIEDQNEPPFSIAITEWDASETSKLGTTPTWLQLLIMDDVSRLNTEMDEILIKAGEWHHVLVTLSEMGKVLVYLDGQKLFESWTAFEGIFCSDPNFSWEVGVGRKSGTGHESDSKNENVAEGMIRRLFAGSVAEIKVHDGDITVEESLYATEFVNSK
ncbi:MAG: hypothetical protein J5950_05620 [Clostridia bacterium]|nr:hypothetical protein [Clostridia bacterium]